MDYYLSQKEITHLLNEGKSNLPDNVKITPLMEVRTAKIMLQPATQKRLEDTSLDILFDEYFNYAAIGKNYRYIIYFYGTKESILQLRYCKFQYNNDDKFIDFLYLLKQKFPQIIGKIERIYNIETGRNIIIYE
jgi:hypothetical protein